MTSSTIIKTTLALAISVMLSQKAMAQTAHERHILVTGRTIDFDGDGRRDGFDPRKRTDGSRQYDWYVQYGCVGEWKRFGNSKSNPNLFRYCDFDQDLKTDILTFSKQPNGRYKWLVKYNGKGEWGNIGDSKVNPSQLHIADFNGDGIADIFTVKKQPDKTYKWLVKYGGNGNWTTILETKVGIGGFIVDDVNGDGISNVVKNH